MSMQAKWNRALLPLLLMAVLVLTSGAQAADTYDVNVTSASFEPGVPVHVNIVGLVNQTISIRVTNTLGDIMAGRDTQLNATGKYVFDWTPSQEGTYNATVVYATGVTITKSFLIQNKVTDADLNQIWVALFGIRDRLATSIEDLRGVVNIVGVISGLGLITSLVVAYYVRRSVPHIQTELERVITAMAKDEMVQKMSQAFNAKSAEVAKLRKMVQDKEQ